MVQNSRHLMDQKWRFQGPAELRTQRTLRCGRAAATAAAAAEGTPTPRQREQPSSALQQPQMLSSEEQQQQQQQLELQLPPSASAASWLADLDDAALQQQAEEWGYERLGRPLPEGVSLHALAETLPDDVFAIDLIAAVRGLAVSLGLMAAGYCYLWYWHSICPWWQVAAAAVVIGTGYFGAWRTAVDCARFAFWPARPALQDALGAVLMAPALMSYEVFRLKYLNHLM